MRCRGRKEKGERSMLNDVRSRTEFSLSIRSFSMIPIELSSRTQPPDRPMDEAGGVIPSAILNEGRKGHKGEDSMMETELSNEKKIENMDKMQKKEGGYSGDIGLEPREEEWMTEEGKREQEGIRKKVSYKEAVRPSVGGHGGGQNMEEDIEEWDENLRIREEWKLYEGVKITDTERGPQIEFSEAEKQRLEKHWKLSLIIKLLGGAVNFMLLRRRLQTLWGKRGTVELSVIGNRYMVVSFQNVEDYIFALE